jgi:hypothetical protein
MFVYDILDKLAAVDQIVYYQLWEISVGTLNLIETMKRKM